MEIVCPDAFLYMFSRTKYRETILNTLKCCSKNHQETRNLSKSSDKKTKETGISVMSDDSMAEASPQRMDGFDPRPIPASYEIGFHWVFFTEIRHKKYQIFNFFL